MATSRTPVASCVTQAIPSRCGCTTSRFPELGRAVPYGVYDIAGNTGWVSVGIDHDTASFAVNAIRRWWQTMGQARYPGSAQPGDHR